ncbi:MAG: chemotaxis protein CheB [Pseudomonadota bacterium]
MPNTRVMVVDDSAAMRALFCDILDNAKGVTVCGVAANADEARDQLDELKPDVLTLDVEMPGMSGMEFLEEIMAERPMPVIMLSSITQAGTGTAAKALELGAVHCFPKPLHSNREEFDKTVQQLGEIVQKAALGELIAGGEEAATNGEADGDGGYTPNGHVVTLAFGVAGIDTAKRVLAAYPKLCPPTIMVIEGEADAIDKAVSAMRTSVACEIEKAVDGLPLKPGRVYLAYDPARHIIVEAGEPPILREVDRDPVNGIRPSADLLMGSMARASVPALGGVLTGSGADGAKGLQILKASGGKVFAQTPADYAPRGRYDALKSLNIEFADLAPDSLSEWIIEQTAA